MKFWNELEGQTVEGLYPLGRLLRHEGRSAWFETRMADGLPATISLAESLTDAEEVMARLQAAQRLRHPNLAAIHSIGQTRLDNTRFVYAVMEYTDQSLSDALAHRSLTLEEARQAAEAAISALTAIHRQGMAHGRVEPAGILAAGETIKLRSDCLQCPGATREGDVVGLGATLFEALTQRKPSSAEDERIVRIPAPFAEIVRNSLTGRWTLAQAAIELRSSAPGKAQSPGNATPASGLLPAGPSPTDAPPPAARTLSPAGEKDREKRFAPRLVYPALTAGLAALIFLGGLVLRRNTRPNPPVGKHAAVDTLSKQLPSPAQPIAAGSAQSKQSSTVQEESFSSARSAQPATQSGPALRTVWRVVAYTYKRRDQAEQMVDQINRNHPRWQAAVFNPRGNRAPYLVTIGGSMDHGHALELRGKAREMGLPADTYARNFPD